MIDTETERAFAEVAKNLGADSITICQQSHEKYCRCDECFAAFVTNPENRLTSPDDWDYADDVPLTFEQLQEANLLRCENSFKHSINDWSPTDWACALAGEVGEACNLIKKFRRGENISAHDIADEIADAVIYADLLCTRLEVNLQDAIRRKFNEVSDRVKSEIRL